MDRLIATYHLTGTASDIRSQAEALALEQSVEMPAEAITDDTVRDTTLGRVVDIAPLDDGRHAVRISLAASTTGFEAGQLMNMLFGNCSLQPQVQLVDVEWPAALLAAFPGPRHGIAGIRALLGVPDRALTCTALKPQGLPPEGLARLCATFAEAGLDIIKDDHGIADQAYSPFAARVRACQRAVRERNAATGRFVCYAPSLSGGPRQLREQLAVAAGEGVAMVLASPMLMGLPVFRELVDEGFSGPVLAHPALSGALRIAPPLFYGRLFRLFGADAVIFPNFGGRFSYSRETCHALVSAARAPWPGVKPALPVPAGGMTVARVPEMIAAYGRDTVLLIGGGLLSAREQLLARSREFVAAVAAASLQENEA
jgi:ribulose-bisphosphate carboxylase large chain